MAAIPPLRPIVIHANQPHPQVMRVLSQIGRPVTFVPPPVLAPDAGLAGRGLQTAASRFSANAEVMTGGVIDRQTVRSILETFFGKWELLQHLGSRSIAGLYGFYLFEPKYSQEPLSEEEIESTSIHLLPYYRFIAPKLPTSLEQAFRLQKAIRELLPSHLNITLPGEYGAEKINAPLDYGPPKLEGEPLLLYHLMDHPDLFAFVCATAGVSDTPELFRIGSPHIKVLSGECLGLRHQNILLDAGIQYATEIQAILQKEGVALDDFTETLRRLRIPFYPEVPNSGEFPSGLLDREQNKSEIQRIIREEADSGRRLHILLGGTLFYEVNWMAKTILEGGVDDSWDVAMIGYSMDFQELRRMQRKLDQSAIPDWLKRRISLEYADLNDSIQWGRIAGFKPNIVVAINSLYVTEYYNGWLKGDLLYGIGLSPALCFADFILRHLPRGGVFITEPGQYVFPHPDDIQPHILEDGRFSGIMVKG